MLRARRLRDRKERAAPDQERERDLARGCGVRGCDRAQHAAGGSMQARKSARVAERAVTDDGDAMPFAPGKDGMLNRAFSQVIQDLVACDAGRANEVPELIEVANVEVAHSPRQ